MASKGSNKENQIEGLIADMHKYDSLGDLQRLLKTAQKVIQADPGNNLGYACKVVALIMLGRTDEAMAVFDKNAKMLSNLNFEKSYCLYRLNRLDEALAAINSVKEPSKRDLELKAQVNYRLEKPEVAIEIYETIARQFESDEYDDERLANLSASLAIHNSKQTMDKYADTLEEDTYETCFNKALLCANQERFDETERLLKISSSMCRETLEYDGSSEEEIDFELSNIKLLLAYVYHKQGRIKEALQIYNDILKLKLDDMSIIAVASNNIVVINKDQNVFDSKKKMRAATQPALDAKLPSQYRKYIALNNSLFNYYSNQHEQSVKLCESIEKKWPELAVHTRIITALNAIKLNRDADPIRLLMKNGEKDDLYVQLACVQLFLSRGEKQKACEILEQLGPRRYRPGIVGALITLNLHLGREDVALKVFEETVEWYKSNKTAGGNLTDLWKQAADFHLRNGQPTVAANSLEQLIKTNPSDLKSLAQLVLAYAQYDLKKAVKTISRLGNMKNIENLVEMESLENSSWLAAKRSEKAYHSSPGVAIKDAAKKRKNRKHRGKFPKDYDASATPDPERWLPKYERTGFRKKRDRRMKDIIKGSQGTASGQSDQFDFTSKLTSENVEESPTGIDASAMAKNRGKKNVSQKKKKGRR